DWYSRREAATVTCVTPPRDRVRDGLGPYRRLQETVGDTLLGKSKKAKVVSVALKPRVAILMAALRAQVCYWFNTITGNFDTSPFYRDEPHGWVKQFNAARPADAWLGKEWKKLRPMLDYAKYSGPDDFFAEGVGFEQGQSFPHPFVKGSNPKEP